MKAKLLACPFCDGTSFMKREMFECKIAKNEDGIHDFDKSMVTSFSYFCLECEVRVKFEDLKLIEQEVEI